jgi:hypothetical protein
MKTTISAPENASFHNDLLKSLLVCAKRGLAGQVVKRLSIKMFVEVLDASCEELQLSRRLSELDDLRPFCAQSGILHSNEYDNFAIATDNVVKVFLKHLEILDRKSNQHVLMAKDLIAEFPPEELNEKPCEGCEGCTNRFCEKR